MLLSLRLITDVSTSDPNSKENFISSRELVSLEICLKYSRYQQKLRPLKAYLCCVMENKN